MGALGVPTLLVWGADDQVTPISAIGAACGLLKPRQCHVIADCGHMAPFERPRDVAGMIAAFAALTQKEAAHDQQHDDRCAHRRRRAERNHAGN
jgi:hypothetical protein